MKKIPTYPHFKQVATSPVD